MGRFRGVSIYLHSQICKKKERKKKICRVLFVTQCLPEFFYYSLASGNCDCWCPCSQNCGSDGFGDNQLKREAEAEAEAESLPLAVAAAAAGVPEGHSRGIELESGSAN